VSLEAASELRAPRTRPVLPRITRDWEGEAAFIVAGGPSVRGVDLELLRNEHVIAINTSYQVVPWARWWEEHASRVRATFRGEVITVTPRRPEFAGHEMTILNRWRSGGLTDDPTQLACWHTSFTTAVNVARHKGSPVVGALGLDGPVPDGEPEWHHEPHPAKWHRNPRRHKFHAEALEALVPALRDAKMELFNLNPSSAHRMFPFWTLDGMLRIDQHEMDLGS
jgi:hypothetical protein